MARCESITKIDRTCKKHPIKLTKKEYVRDSKLNKILTNEPSDESNDFWLDSTKVANLKANTFQDFLDNKDAILVMFYDPMLPPSAWSKKQVDLAVTMTLRPNSGFAGVNCCNQYRLCVKEGAEDFPYFRLYSRGHVVGSFRDYPTFTAKQMSNFVKNCPIFEDRPVC